MSGSEASAPLHPVTFEAEELYRAHAADLRRYLHRLTGDEEETEDVLHDTFARLIQRPPRNADNLRGWLFKTATNVVRDQARRSKRREELEQRREDFPRPSKLGPDPLLSAERKELRQRIINALGTLNERERVAILMREEGFTHREIAKALSSTTGTIGTLLARAFNKLARALPLDGDDR